MTRRAAALLSVVVVVAAALGAFAPIRLVLTVAVVGVAGLGVATAIALRQVIGEQRAASLQARAQATAAAQAERKLARRLQAQHKVQRRTLTRAERTLRRTRALEPRLAALNQAQSAASTTLREVTAGVSRVETVIRSLDRRVPHPPPPVDQTLDAADEAGRLLGEAAWGGRQQRVVLLLQTYEPLLVFAGIRTAVRAAALLARDLERPLHVVVISATDAPHEEVAASLRRQVSEDTELTQIAGGLSVSTADRRADGAAGVDDADDMFGSGDVWVATYWTTAYALAGLVSMGRVDPDRVVYLVQDFEPGFYPWGGMYAKAASTYQAGFRLLVNSQSLADFVRRETGQIDAEAVFAPELDLTPVRRAASRWEPPRDADTIRVLFYARPTKPRNMYAVGVQALRLWAAQLPPDVRPVVMLAGEDVSPNVDLGPDVEVQVVGKTSLEAYYDVLARTDVGLALMLSPHPGHLALELPQAGIPTVTNQFQGARAAWVEGLRLADPEPAELAAALVDATRDARKKERHTPGMQLVPLGTSLADAVRKVGRGLEA